MSKQVEKNRAPKTGQEGLKERRSFMVRLESFIKRYSDSILALSAVIAVVISVIGLVNTAKYNLRSSLLDASMATQQKSADETQAAVSQQSLDYEAISAFSAQTSVARWDEEAAERAELVATETLVVSTIPAVVTETSEPPSIDAALRGAETAVHEYYQLISFGQYAEAWTGLTPRFQQVLSQGSFLDYQGFWQSVDKVIVIEAVGQEYYSELSQVGVLVRLRFFQSGYDWDRTYIYTLVRSSISGDWKIENTQLLQQ